MKRRHENAREIEKGGDGPTGSALGALLVGTVELEKVRGSKEDSRVRKSSIFLSEEGGAAVRGVLMLGETHTSPDLIEPVFVFDCGDKEGTWVQRNEPQPGTRSSVPAKQGLLPTLWSRPPVPGNVSGQALLGGGRPGLTRHPCREG